MKRFRSTGQAQRFLSVHDPVANLFQLSRPEHQPAVLPRAQLAQAIAACADIAGATLAA